jgi:hypothetical protein
VISEEIFKEYFNMLKMNIACTWDIRSSVFFLTLKILEQTGGLDEDKYSAFTSMICSEVFEQSRVNGDNPTPFKYYDSSGKLVDNGYKVANEDGKLYDTGFSDQLKLFFSGLSWLSFRTTIYTLVAKELGSDLFLHPIRNGFQTSLLNRFRVYDDSTYRSINLAMKSTAIDTLSKITDERNVSVYNLPFFTAWLAKKTNDPLKFIETAYELRATEPFLQARNKLIELEQLHNNNDYANFHKERNKLVTAISAQMHAIRMKYGLESSQGFIPTALIFIWNAYAKFKSLPEIPQLVPEIKGLDAFRNYLPQKGFNSIYRNMIIDLTNIPRLGRYHDIITSKVRLTERADYFKPKTEVENLFGKEYWWKIPM